MSSGGQDPKEWQTEAFRRLSQRRVCRCSAESKAVAVGVIQARQKTFLSQNVAAIYSQIAVDLVCGIAHGIQLVSYRFYQLFA